MILVAYVDDLVIAGSEKLVQEAWKQLNRVLAFGAPPAPLERFLGCRHEYSEPKGKDGAFTLKWDVEDMINKAVKDFVSNEGRL